MKIKYFIISVIYIFPQVIYSNPLPTGSSGRTPNPYVYGMFNGEKMKIDGVLIEEDHEIQMTSELVEIDENGFCEYTSFAPDMPPFRFRQAKIVGNYFLYNTSQNEIEKDIKFPVPAVFNESITDFEVYLDDKKIDYKLNEFFKPRSSFLFYKETFSDRSIEILKKANLLKPCIFDPKVIDLSPLAGSFLTIKQEIYAINEITSEEKDEILNSIIEEFRHLYQNDNGAGHQHRGGSFNLYEFKIKMKPKEKVILKIKYRTVIGDEESFKYSYVLQTGKLWKGKIDKSIIRITPAFPKQLSKYSFSPSKNILIKEGKVDFIFENFEPKEDISVEFKDIKDK